MKKLARVLVIFIGISALIILGGIFYYNNQINSPLLLSSETVFTIAPGSNVEKIATDLERERIIKNKNILLLYLKLNPNYALGFKAGEFKITSDTSLKELVLQLQDASANRNDMSVLIQEGLRYDEISELLNLSFSSLSETKFDKDEYIRIVENPDSYEFSEPAKSFLSEHKPAGKNLEGFLYPDTYFFSKDATALEIINKQVATLSLKLTGDDKAAISKSSYSLYDKLNIASMVEREAFTNDEKADIADVIYKRLEQGVVGVKLLQIDATLLYQANDWKADPVREKAKDGPYNTYTRTGLPPTPICNPGIDSLRASIYPNSNDYFFYLHDSSGNIHFARNQSEHDANVRKYIFNR